MPTPTPLTLVSTTKATAVPPPGATTISLTAFKFEPNAPTVSAGTAVFFLKNLDEPPSAFGGGLRHNLLIGSRIGEPLASSANVSGGQSVVFTVEGLEPGAYVIWCSIPSLILEGQDHADSGMVGTLTVTL
jgi:plastocyanin